MNIKTEELVTLVELEITEEGDVLSRVIVEGKMLHKMWLWDQSAEVKELEGLVKRQAVYLRKSDKMRRRLLPALGCALIVILILAVMLLS